MFRSAYEMTEYNDIEIDVMAQSNLEDLSSVVGKKICNLLEYFKSKLH